MQATGHDQTLDAKFLDLITLLRDEEDELRGLIALLQEEKRGYLSFSLDTLQECNKRKETMALKLRMLEETRVALIEQLATAVQQDPYTATLRDVCAWAPEPLRGQLEDRAGGLRAITGGIRELIAENSAYIEYSLCSIKESITLLNQASAPSSTYNPDGKLGGSSERSGIFVQSRI